MRNYISVNAKYYKMGEIDRISSHNFRQSKVDYLLPKEQIKFQNQNLIFDENFNVSKKDLSLETLDKSMRNQFLKLLKLKQDILKKNNAKHRKNENELIEMVVALSEEQALNYLENGVDLMTGFKNFAKNIYKKHGLKPIGISLHLDEGNIKDNITKLNIHAHLTFFNYHFEKEKSVLRTLQKQDFKEMQDIAANSFQEAGLNFVRGEGKEITNKKHIERNDFILAKQELELKEQILKINNLKNKEKELLKKLDKGTLEYDEKYKEIGILQQQEKNLRSKVKELSLNTSQELNSVVSDLTNNLVNKHIEKNLLGNKVINNIDDLKKDIFKEIKNAQNLKLVIKEFDILKQENQALKSDLKQKEDQNSIILDKLNEERNKNKVLEQDKGQNLAQNQKALQIMDKQQKTILRQNRTNTRRTNQRNKYFQKLMRDNNLTKAMQTRKFLRDNKTRDINKNKIEKTNEIYDRNR